MKTSVRGYSWYPASRHQQMMVHIRYWAFVFEVVRMKPGTKVLYSEILGWVWEDRIAISSQTPIITCHSPFPGTLWRPLLVSRHKGWLYRVVPFHTRWSWVVSHPRDYYVVSLCSLFELSLTLLSPPDFFFFVIEKISRMNCLSLSSSLRFLTHNIPGHLVLVKLYLNVWLPDVPLSSVL